MAMRQSIFVFLLLFAAACFAESESELSSDSDVFDEDDWEINSDGEVEEVNSISSQEESESDAEEDDAEETFDVEVGIAEGDSRKHEGKRLSTIYGARTGKVFPIVLTSTDPKKTHLPSWMTTGSTVSMKMKPSQMNDVLQNLGNLFIDQTKVSKKNLEGDEEWDELPLAAGTQISPPNGRFNIAFVRLKHPGGNAISDTDALGHLNRIKAYFEGMSYDKVSLNATSAQVFGPYEAPVGTGSRECKGTYWFPKAPKAAKDAGFRPQDFNVVVYAVPPEASTARATYKDTVSECNWDGYAYVDCIDKGSGSHPWNTALVHADAPLATVAHELGHTLGLRHASYDRNGDDRIDKNVVMEEYGDISGVMGSGSVSDTLPINAPHKDQMGWMSDGEVRQLDWEECKNGCSFELSSMEGPKGGLKILRIRRPGMYKKNYYGGKKYHSDFFYYISYFGANRSPYYANLNSVTHEFQNQKYQYSVVIRKMRRWRKSKESEGGDYHAVPITGTGGRSWFCANLRRKTEGFSDSYRSRTLRSYRRRKRKKSQSHMLDVKFEKKFSSTDTPPTESAMVRITTNQYSHKATYKLTVESLDTVPAKSDTVYAKFYGSKGSTLETLVTREGTITANTKQTFEIEGVDVGEVNRMRLWNRGGDDWKLKPLIKVSNSRYKKRRKPVEKCLQGHNGGRLSRGGDPETVVTIGKSATGGSDMPINFRRALLTKEQCKAL